MKKITLFFALLISSFGFSQNIVVNGDFTTDLSSWSNYVADFAGVSATFSASNGEANITNITNAGGATWHVQLNQVLSGSQIAALTVGQSYKVSFTARSNANGRSLKLFFGEDGGGFASVHQQDFSLTTTNTTYESSIFVLGATYGAMKLGFEMGLSNNPVFIDNVKLEQVVNLCTNGIQDPGETGIDCGGSCTPCPAPPSTAALTPPARLAADVISIFSDAYNNISPITMDAGWCGAPSISATTSIPGDNIYAYTNKPCQGIDFSSARQDFTGITNVHVDIFIQLGTDLVGKVFNLKIVNGNGNEIQFPIDINGLSPAPVPGTWYSYDKAITLTGAFNDIYQAAITSNFVDSVWYDNFYFHKNTTLSTNSFNKTDFSLYPNPTQNSWTIKTQNVMIASVKVFDVLGKNVLSLKPNATESTIEGSSLKAGLYFAQIETASGISSLKLVKN